MSLLWWDNLVGPIVNIICVKSRITSFIVLNVNLLLLAGHHDLQRFSRAKIYIPSRMIQLFIGGEFLLDASLLKIWLDFQQKLSTFNVIISTNVFLNRAHDNRSESIKKLD